MDVCSNNTTVLDSAGTTSPLRATGREKRHWGYIELWGAVLWCIVRYHPQTGR